ncbi:hypothetical protein [Nostoc sp.]|uniref:hypothetical protein n=1 Tax=Nostoc sp. TaxID=1180 RepID=UPI002FFA4338
MLAHVEILHVTKHTQKPSSITIKVLLVPSTLAFDCSAEWSISPNVYGFERSLLFLLTHLASGSTHFLGSSPDPLDSQPTYAYKFRGLMHMETGNKLGAIEDLHKAAGLFYNQGQPLEHKEILALIQQNPTEINNPR